MSVRPRTFWLHTVVTRCYILFPMLHRGKSSDVPRTPTTGFRLPPELKKRIDAYAAQLSEEMGGIHISRAFAVSRLLRLALDAEVRRLKRKR